MIFTGLCLVAALVAQDARQLTLDEAVAIGVENAFSVRIAEAQVEKAKRQVAQARGNLGPSVTVSGTYARFEGNTGFGSGSGGSGGGATIQQTAAPSIPNDSKQVQLQLRQIIDLNGTVRKSVEAAKFAEMASQAGLGAEVNSLKEQVRAAYFNVLAAKRLVGVQEKRRESARERLDKARLRVQEGAIPEFDVLRLQNDERQAEQAVVQARGDYTLARQALNNLLGRPIETEFDAVETDVLPEAARPAEEYVAMAAANRPELQQADLVIRSLGKRREVEENGLRPTVALSAQHTRVIDPPFGQRDNGTLGALTVSWPVFDSGITRARVAAAQQDETVARIQRDQILLAVSLEVRSALTRYSTAKEALGVAESGEALAREALRLAQLRYDEGAGILLDVIQAQADLTAAESGVVQARIQVWQAYSALQKAVGRDELAPPVAAQAEVGK